MRLSPLEQDFRKHLLELEEQGKIMTRKERQAANGIGSQKVAKGADRSAREQRFKPLTRKEEVRPISVTEKLEKKGKK